MPSLSDLGTLRAEAVSPHSDWMLPEGGAFFAQLRREGRRLSGPVSWGLSSRRSLPSPGGSLSGHVCKLTLHRQPSVGRVRAGSAVPAKCIITQYLG